MTELALFLIPGFIFTQATAHCRAIRKDLQWPYLFEITIISCIFCLVVRLILGIVAYCLPDDFENTVRSIWSAWVPFKYTVTLLSVSLLAWAAGSNKWLQNHVTRPISNPFHNRLYALVAAPQIMLELRNSKVYIAKLLDASFEDHHAEKVVVIAPYSSGRRASPDSKLVIDTFYNFDDDNRVEITIPYREVVSLRAFNKEFFERCIEAKLVSITTPPPETGEPA